MIDRQYSKNGKVNNEVTLQHWDWTIETDRKWLIRFRPKTKMRRKLNIIFGRNRNETENLRSFSAENENETSRPT